MNPPMSTVTVPEAHPHLASLSFEKINHTRKPYKHRIISTINLSDEIGSVAVARGHCQKGRCEWGCSKLLARYRQSAPARLLVARWVGIVSAGWRGWCIIT